MQFDPCNEVTWEQQKQFIKELLGQGVVKLEFIKKSDGSRRVMLATTHPALMPPPPPKNPDKPSRPLPSHLTLVWDVENDALKSFDMSSLVEEPVLVKDLGPHDAP